MRLHLSSGLTLRMVAVVTSLHLVLASLLYFGVGKLVEDGYESQFLDYVRSDIFSGVLAVQVGEDNTININENVVDETLLSGRIIYIQVLNKDENVVYFGGIEPEVDSFKEDFEFGSNDDNIYHIASGIYGYSGDVIGEVRIGYDESLTKEQIELAYSRALFFSALYLVIALGVTIFFGRRLTHPIQALQGVARKIAHGQIQQEIEVLTSVLEIQELARSMEFMRAELVSQSQSMEHQALHDGLTDLPNRVLLQDRVHQTIAYRHPNKESSALILIDLDRFKELNDTLGHLAGDNVLKQAACRLVNTLRRVDTVARLGGDEFALWLPGASQNAAMVIAEKVYKKLTMHYECDGHTVSLGASLGVSLYPDDAESYEELLMRADVAMYAAKKAGGGVKRYHPEMDSDALEKLTLMTELSGCIERNELFTVYQPKIHLETGEVSGVEALMRWNHPVRGVVPPDKFIPAAERSGMIHSMTMWMLRESIKQISKWHSMGIKVPIAVNLSPNNFDDENLPGRLVSTLKEFNVPSKLLELEITETAVFSDPLRAKEMLDHLHAHGITISIDDFGTGYSSLSQLRKMPVSVVKVDRSFVDHMIENQSDKAIVQATIHMAHDLGLCVVAEGVEDLKTLNALKELHCDWVQGYYFSAPLKAGDFEKWLAKFRDSTHKKYRWWRGKKVAPSANLIRSLDI